MRKRSHVYQAAMILLLTLSFVLAACSGGTEDAVKGSLPPKGQRMVPDDLGQIIVYFKGTVDTTTEGYLLSLDNINIDAYEGEELVAQYDGDEAFVSTGFPKLLESDEADDTLVLTFTSGTSGFISDFQTYTDRWYELTITGYRLDCERTESSPCWTRNIPFTYTFENQGVESLVYESEYSASEDPPYMTMSVPPNETDFASAPPMPPHANFNLIFSKAVPQLTLVSHYNGDTVEVQLTNDLLSSVTDYFIALNGDSVDNQVIPFDVSRHKNLLIKYMTPLEVNTLYAFTIVSAPDNLADIIDECTDPYATTCSKPDSIEDILYAPSSDSTFAPLIKATADDMEETSSGSGIYKGLYLVPSGSPGTGNQPGDIAFQFRTARVRIDYPGDGMYYLDTQKGMTVVDGVYATNTESGGTVNSVYIEASLAFPEECEADPPYIESGYATLNNGVFTFSYSSEFRDKIFSWGCGVVLKATANSNDSKGGYDIIHPQVYGPAWPPAITFANDEEVIIAPLPLEIAVGVSANGGIAWVKFDGDLAPWYGAPNYYTYHTYNFLEDGEHYFSVEAKDIFGDTTSETFSFTFYADADDDEMPDYWEELYGLTDTDPFSDDAPYGDADGDGLYNIEEYNYDTKPNDTDTDDDGVSDFDEIENGTDPLVDDNEVVVYYVDATNGGDSYDGLCEEHVCGNCGPWKTLGEVSSHVFNAGNVVKFKRGEVWYWEPEDGDTLRLVIAGTHATFTNYGDQEDDLPIFDGRRYLDDVLSQTLAWENLGIGDTIWRAAIPASLAAGKIDVRTLLMQSLLTSYSYDDNFQRLALVSENCETADGYEDLTSYTYCQRDTYWESCEEVGGDCHYYNVSIYGNTCFNMPENAAYCEDPNCGSSPILCEPDEQVSFFLHTLEDPNIYKVFTLWDGGIVHDNYFTFKVLNASLSWEKISGYDHVYKSNVNYSDLTMSNCSTEFGPACEAMPTVPTYKNPRYCEDYNDCNYYSNGLTYADSLESLEAATDQAYYVTAGDTLYVNLETVNYTTCSGAPCGGMYFKDISTTNDQGADGIVIDGLKLRFTANSSAYSGGASIFCPNWKDGHHCKVINSVIDTTAGNAIDSNDDVINNQLLFFDQYGIRFYGGGTVHIEDNILIGQGGLDWGEGHAGEISGIMLVFNHSGSTIKNNIVGYGLDDDIYLETGTSNDVIEKNIVFGTGSVFQPGPLNDGTFFHYEDTGAKQARTSIWIRHLSNGTKIRNNIVYKAGIALLKGIKCSLNDNPDNHLYDYNNSFYNTAVAILDGSSYSTSYNNFGYNSEGGVVCPECEFDFFLYGSSGTYGTSSDYNFWANHDGAEIGWQDSGTFPWNDLIPGDTYSLAAFKTAYTTREQHSITDEDGIALPRRSSCDTGASYAPDYYPRPTWPEVIADVLAGCFPDFNPLPTDDSYVLIDAGKCTGAVWDGDAPDIGAIEYDLPPPDPSGVSGTRLTGPDRIDLQWDDYLAVSGKNSFCGGFDLKNYVLVKTGGDHSILVNPYTDEFIDYSAAPETNYTYTLYTIDYQANQSCYMAEITCDPTCGDPDIVENISGGPDCEW